MIIIDYKDRRPIYEQIVERFKELIISGGIEADSQLPSVRNLAIDLSINPNTIQRAYAELERTGFIYSVKGKGSFIAPHEDIQKQKKIAVLNATREVIRQAKLIHIPVDEMLNFVKMCYEEEKR